MFKKLMVVLVLVFITGVVAWREQGRGLPKSLPQGIAQSQFDTRFPSNTFAGPRDAFDNYHYETAPKVPIRILSQTPTSLRLCVYEDCSYVCAIGATNGPLECVNDSQTRTRREEVKALPCNPSLESQRRFSSKE